MIDEKSFEGKKYILKLKFYIEVNYYLSIRLKGSNFWKCIYIYMYYTLIII